MGSIKNRALLPVGTRVKPALDKMPGARVGTVVDVDEQRGTLWVRWDADPSLGSFDGASRLVGGFAPFELRRAEA